MGNAVSPNLLAHGGYEDAWVCYGCNLRISREDTVRRYGTPPNTRVCAVHNRCQTGFIDVQTGIWSTSCVQHNGLFYTRVSCSDTMLLRHYSLEDIREETGYNSPVPQVVTISDDDDFSDVDLVDPDDGLMSRPMTEEDRLFWHDWAEVLGIADVDMEPDADDDLPLVAVGTAGTAEEPTDAAVEGVGDSPMNGPDDDGCD